MAELLLLTALIIPGILGLTVSAAMVFYAQEAYKKAGAFVITVLFAIHIMFCLFWR